MAAKEILTPARHRFADVLSLVHEACVTHRSTVKIGHKLCAWGHTLLDTLVIVQHLLRSFKRSLDMHSRWWTPQLQQEQLVVLTPLIRIPHWSHTSRPQCLGQQATYTANRVHASQPVGQSRTTLSQLQPAQAPGATVAAQLATQLLMPAALVPLQDTGCTPVWH